MVIAKHVAVCQRIVFLLLPLSYVRHTKFAEVSKEKRERQREIEGERESAMKAIPHLSSAALGQR